MLEKIYNELDREHDREALMLQRERHESEAKELHISQRKANVFCKLNMQKQATLDREALLKGSRQEPSRSGVNTRRLGARLRGAGTSSGSGGSGGKDTTLNTATQLTESLRHTSQMMSNQLQQSMNAIQTLSESSATVKSTRNEYEGLTGLLSDSNKILTKLKRREFTDRILIYLGVAFFCLTVLYIVRKRLFYSSASSENSGITGYFWGSSSTTGVQGNPQSVAEKGGRTSFFNSFGYDDDGFAH